jgi:hypothetical protein
VRALRSTGSFEQDQADVLDRALTAIALERGGDAARAAQELGLDVCGESVEHRFLPFGFRPMLTAAALRLQP